MHHPEQYKVMATGIHQQRLREGLASQEVSRNQPASVKWQSISKKLVKYAQSMIVSTKSAAGKLAQINTKTKQSHTRSQFMEEI